MRYFINVLVIICIYFPKIWGQGGIWRGSVHNPAGESLVFVTLLPDGDPNRGVLSDIEGNFEIVAKMPIKSLVVRYVGFETLVLDSIFLEKYRQQPMKIVLRPVQFDLPEVTILPGENPADAFIKKAVANRHLNNPERQPAYRCTTYNKFVFDARPHREIFERWHSKQNKDSKNALRQQQQFEKSEKEFQHHHLFLMETVTDRRFRSPDQVTEEVLLNRVSGLERSGMAALASAVQPFSFYSDYLQILDKNFVNPISPGSTDLYFFNIEDTLFSNKDTVWVISFRPRRGKVFESLEGVLHLSQYQWAVKNVRATPAFEGSNLDMKIEQQYQLVEDSITNSGFWFPEQLNFELELKKYPSPMMGMKASGKSFVSNPRVLKKLPSDLFDPEQPLFFQKNAETRADSLWQKWHSRHPLQIKERNTYRWADSIGAAQKWNKWATVMRVLNSGRLPLNSWLNLELGQLLRLNDFEQIRLGVGFSTAQSNPNLSPKRWETGAYIGYGFADGTLKYGINGLWRLRRSSETLLKIEYQNDLTEPGILYELPNELVFDRSLYARRLDRTETWQLRLSSRLWRGANAAATLRRQTAQPNYSYQFLVENSPASSFLFSETSLFFRQTFGERTTTLFGSPADRTQRFPVLETAWTHGWLKNVGSPNTFNRYLLALHQSVFIRRLGKLNYRFELGKVDGRVPLARLFTQNQSAGSSGFSLFFVPNTFQSMPDTLWLSDRFFNLFFAQEVGNVFYKRIWSAPRLSLLYNMAWSSLRHPQFHQQIGFLTAQPPLHETGIRIDNLLKINYINFAYLGLGGAVFYRWGAFSDPQWQRNLAFRLALRLSL